MSSIYTGEDWDALRDHENLLLILDEQRDVDNQIRELHYRRNELERKGLPTLERIQRRDFCAPRARYGQRAAELRGWVDANNNRMQDYAYFGAQPRENSLVSRASTYFANISQVSSTNMLPTPPRLINEGYPNRIPQPPSDYFENRTRDTVRATSSTETILYDTPLPSNSYRPFNADATSSGANSSQPFNSEASSSRVFSSTCVGERATLNDFAQVRGQNWITRNYQGGHQAKTMQPALKRHTVTWPTLEEPINFVPLLERALSNHSSRCPLRRERYIVHSDDRNSPPILHCDACQTGILVENQFTYFLRLNSQAGGHLLSLYDQWRSPWHRRQVIPEDQAFVERAMKFVVRCIESVMQKTGVIDPRNNVSPPPGLSRGGSQHSHNGAPRI